ncbi:o-succinylbenzoate--CoA ligase [Lentibacillus sp. JNUCC-1]|uniref:o-succinylbenzoate--CoA ligase n=1 Tax=Lentibacillus sp. JNUCC-1 TaxID=2654513 RepID=UPI0012E85708|nr:o-succinylbenzoate--CoA ligase [Lentibacillus sp. JNUCC-1]MUV39252.1 o-succinylbenzoate--CoA ligase [Lentibacillus sp. JNUCC-1]
MSESMVPHWLTKQAELNPDATAIELDSGEQICFSELEQRSKTYARKLAQAGVKEDMHVGVLSSNSVQMVTLIHALSYLGAVAVMLNIRLTDQELSYQVDDADVEKVFVHDELKSTASKMQFASKVHTFSDVEQLEEVEVLLKTELDLNKPCTIMYTSGTTGHPKGVVHTYGNHWWSAVGSVLNLGLKPEEKWLCVLPLFHVGGFSILIRSMMYGMPVYLLESFNAQAVNHAICHKGVTIASVVTVMLQRLIEDLGDNHYPETFRCMLLGGGPVPQPILEKSSILSIPVVQTYGMTETSSQIATLSARDALKKIGSAGKALVPSQLHVTAEPGEVGDILVKGPMVTKGYYKRPDATKASFEEGWLKTGDLGRVDQEGYLYVVERHHDLIISGGENIYPTEIENVLYQIPEVKEAAVVGRRDAEWGQVPVAYAVVGQEDANALTKERMMAVLIRELAPYKRPKDIIFLDQLPRNATNKIMRHKLR